MNREIEFRAWDTQLETYTYSGWGEKTFAIFVKRTNCSRYIIEEYTNRKDKNGKKIYEGDKVESRCMENDTSDDGYKKGDLMFIGVVLYVTNLCAFVLRCGLDFQITSKMDLKITGTIHDKS